VRVARLTLAAVGVAGVVWGVWLLHDDGVDRLRSVAFWLVGGVLLHDAVLAPLVVLAGVVAARVLPQHRRTVAAVTFLVWGTLTLAVANVLLDVGGKPDNESLMNRPYVVSWLVLTAVLAGVALVVPAVLARRHRGVDA
jgi:hypothetical protein